MLNITEQDGDVLVEAKVVPKASRDRVVGELGGALKITISAAAERGAANQAVCQLLAKVLGVRAKQVVVESGHTSPRKTIRIRGVSAVEVRQAVEASTGK